MELFVDGSSYLLNGQRHTGYAVTTEHEIIQAEALPWNLSAQAAELKALTEALKLASGKVCNIYTDSKYSFDICHATGKLWKERGFVTASGKRVAHGQMICELLEAIEKPKQVAVIHCKGHQKGQSRIARGNRRVDRGAKEAALKNPVQAPLLIPTFHVQK